VNFLAQVYSLQQLLGGGFNYNPIGPSSQRHIACRTISALKFEPTFRSYWQPAGLHKVLVPQPKKPATLLRLSGVHLVNKLAIAFNVSLCASLPWLRQVVIFFFFGFAFHSLARAHVQIVNSR